jgi:hypothetical protein
MFAKARLLSGGISAVVLSTALSIGLLPVHAHAMAEPGKQAPAIALVDLDGKPVSLSDFKGRWVALEWTNPECPFVQKHYNSKNMQDTQKFAADKKIAWVQINSTNPSHGDYKSPQQMKAWNTSMQAVLSHATLDPGGKTGKAYGAKTTPQMVLISPDGKVVYNGAIDSVRSANPADIPKATNYFKQAMAESAAGKPVSTPSTTPYGCSIKY